MLDAVPASSCSIVVEAAVNRAATCFLGLIVHGKAEAVDAFLKAAAGRRISAGAVGGEKGEAMAVFRAGTGAGDAIWLLREAQSGRLGKLRVEIIVSPAGKAGDGVDLDREVRATNPDYLALPDGR